MYVHMLSAAPGIWQCVWRALTRSAREPYRPEKHYMRGPGPKYRARGIERNAGMLDAAATSASDESKGE